MNIHYWYSIPFFRAIRRKKNNQCFLSVKKSIINDLSYKAATDSVSTQVTVLQFHLVGRNYIQWTLFLDSSFRARRLTHEASHCWQSKLSGNAQQGILATPVSSLQPHVFIQKAKGQSNRKKRDYDRAVTGSVNGLFTVFIPDVKKEKAFFD